ncbi:MAG: hypothetical protein RIQ89_1645 [Bacteroidota bacterium]
MTLLMCFLPSTNLFSQKLDYINLSESANGMRFLEIQGHYGNGFINAASNQPFSAADQSKFYKKKEIMVDFIGEQLNLQYALSLPHQPCDFLYDLIVVNDQLHYLTGNENKRGDSLFLLLHTWQDGTKKFISSIIDTIPLNSQYVYTYPHFSKSNDEGWFTYFYTTIDRQDDALNLFFNTSESESIQWHKQKIATKTIEKEFILEQFIVANNGTIALLAMQLLNGKKIKTATDAQHLLYVAPYKNGYHRATIRDEKHFLNTAGLQIDLLNNKTIVAGYYADESSYSAAGVFIFTMDSMYQGNTKYVKFDNSFLATINSNRLTKRSDELIDYKIDKLIVRRDGGVVLIAENYKETITNSFDFFSQTYITNYVYYYGSIMLLNINPDGKFLWSHVINKDQQSQNDNGYLSSYATFLGKNAIKLMFNRNISSAGNIAYVDIDIKGNKKVTAMNLNKEEIYLVPTGALQLNEDEIAMPILKENKLMLVKITY